MTARISTKGQLVIPLKLRKALHLKAGDAVTFTMEGDKLVLQREEAPRAKLVMGKFGREVLLQPPGLPPITTDSIKAILDEVP